MRTATVGEITRAIDEAAEKEPGGAIAFDGDGTLWSGDVGEDFFDAALKHGPREVTRAALVREAAEAGIEAKGSARDVAHALHAAYLGGSFSEERICEIVAWIAAGWTRAELDRFCAEAVVAWDLSARLHGEAMRVVEHARKVGIEVFLVSASPRGIVEAAAKVVGIEVANVTAVEERVSADGVVECGVLRPIPYGEGKVTNLRAKLGPTRKLYAAFGDNAFDVPLLCAAQHAVAVRPKMRLLERRSEVPGLVVLEQV
ncbi:MAG: HAD-IB family phosphatase [Labilithrix sp.]|nr:HAD-IB family phosphatase [Labilithrix sp.]MCW5812077.1 HAD-IB family phosphatase [Labilithrix sp.]